MRKLRWSKFCLKEKFFISSYSRYNFYAFYSFPLFSARHEYACIFRNLRIKVTRKFSKN